MFSPSPVRSIARGGLTVRRVPVGGGILCCSGPIDYVQLDPIHREPPVFADQSTELLDLRDFVHERSLQMEESARDRH